uniref:Peptidase_M13_N domain-containing protein n=1 Tax=Panagrellus redivivus TaxID=6233 RepID=A0A7E4UNC2_PANRE
MVMGLYSCCCIFVAVWLQWAAAESTVYSTAAKNTIKELERTIDFTVDVCDDFYAHVCSEVGESESTKAEKDIESTIHQFLTKRSWQQTDTGAIEKYYKANSVCRKAQANRKTKVDATKIIEKSLSKFEEYLQSINFDQQTKLTGTIFAQVTAYLAAKHHLKTLVSIGIEKPPTNESIYAAYGMVMVVRDLKLTLELDDYENDNINATLKDTFSEHYPLDGDNHEKKEKDINAMMEFEYQILIKIFNMFKESGAPEGIDMTVKDATMKFPGIEWKTLIDTLSELSGESHPSLCSRDDCVLHYFAPEIVGIISDVITKTEPKVFKIYAQTRLMIALQYEELFGQNRKLNCIGLVERMFALVLQHMYNLKTYPTVADRAKLKRHVFTI